MANLKIVQSSWTKGMQSKVLSARNDTDILSKGASILDNVSIMQQGGLRKRPCAVQTQGRIASTFVGIVRFSNSPNLWAIGYDNNVTLTFSNIDTGDIKDVNISNGSISPIGKLDFIQDGNTLLFTPFWVDVTFDGTNFTPTPFIFNSYPVSQSLKHSVFFWGTYDPNQTVHVHFYGDGSSTAITQAQNSNAYLNVGQKVLLYTERGASCQFNIIIGAIININGLILKVIGDNSPAYGKALICVAMLGSSQILPTDKVAQGFLDAWVNIYTSTSTVDDIIIRTNSFSNTCPPQYITNYQNRIISSNTIGSNTGAEFEKIPFNNTALWCSASGTKYSFLQTVVDDASPFSVITSGNISPSINNIFAGDYLYIMTNVGIYAFVNNTNSTFTTTNINLKKVGNHRCASIKPIQHDGQLFYVQENRRAIFSLSTDTSGNLLDIDRSILCPTFMRNISHLCETNYLYNIDENGVTDNSSYLFCLSDEIDQETNLPTGRKCILSYQYMSVQALDGWTRWTFSDKSYPIAMFSIEDRLFVKVYAPDAPSGNDTIIYEFKLGVFTDDFQFDSASIPAIKILTNPYSLRDQINGDLLFKRKKYSKIFLYYLDTETVTINNKIHNVGALFDGNDIGALTGILEYNPPSNYEILKQLEITHQHNSDFKMIALQTNLEVGD